MDILFRTISEFKKYITVDAQTDFDTLKPFIEEATTLFMVDLLSQAQIDTLQASYDTGDATITDANLAKLLPYVQRTLAYYAMYQSIDQLAVSIGDSGIMEIRSQESDPVPKYKIDNLKSNFISSADTHAEKMLSFLEKNASVTVYNDWFSSDAYTGAQGLIVNSALIADEHIDINASRRLFKRLKKRIAKIEKGYIKRLIGTDQYDELVTQIKDGSLKDSVENMLLVEMLMPIISKKSLYETIPSLRIGITNDGITIFSTSDGTVSKQAAGIQEVNALRHSLKEGDTGYESDVQELKDFIEFNIEDYPLIEASTAFTSKPVPGPKRPPENNRDSKHFSV